MSSSSWWWPPNWPAPKGSEHLQRDYETSTTTNTTKNLEEERLIGRIGVLTKRVDQLETQFHGLYDSFLRHIRVTWCKLFETATLNHR